MSNSSPRVGIVIRTKDRPLFVTRALRSVMAQSFGDWRVVLVNDGGNRTTLEAAIAAAGLARHFEGGQMSALHHEASIGRSAAFNSGATALNSDFVCCLDDDDTWDPEFLTALVDLYDRTKPLAPDLGGVAALVTAIREDIQIINGQETLVPMGEDGLPNAFKRTDFFLNPIAYATYRHDLYPVQWMLERKAVLAEGGFPTEFNVMEDRAFMARFLEHWRLAILDRKLAFHHRRVRRSGDTQQSVVMNTLDNPSYNWRLYSDLARGTVNSPDGKDTTAGVSPAMVRAVAATLLKEMNDETSALWHKISDEAATLRAQIESLSARLASAAPPEAVQAPEQDRVWSLWGAVGPTEIGYRLGVDVPFLDRLSLSMATTPQGLALHASPVQSRMVVQVSDTQDWCALELALAGLASQGEGLRCEVILSVRDGCLLETALSIWKRDDLGQRAHSFVDSHMHACPPGGSLRVVRDFLAHQIESADTPRLSIALPRQARNFRLVCHDLVVSRI